MTNDTSKHDQHHAILPGVNNNENQHANYFTILNLMVHLEFVYN